MTDLESPAASAVESPEDFVRLVFADDGIPEYEVEHSNLGRNLVDGIRARDAAVRREALREAADWLARCVPDEPTERNEWQQVLVEAADSLCAIADGAPKDSGAVRWPLRALAESEET